MRLAERDLDGNTRLDSDELTSLQLWLDDGDAKLESGELRDLADYEIFAIGTRLSSSNDLMQSNAFLLSDSAIMTESVWFASCGDVVDDPTEDNQINSAPNAVLDFLTTSRNTAQQIDVLENDTDPDGGALSILSFAQPQHGTVTTATDGTLTYTPEDGFICVDYFVYIVTDGENESLTTVRVDVVEVADDPDTDQPNNGNGNDSSDDSKNAAETATAVVRRAGNAAKHAAILR